MSLVKSHQFIRLSAYRERIVRISISFVEMKERFRSTCLSAREGRLTSIDACFAVILLRMRMKEIVFQKIDKRRAGARPMLVSAT